MDLLVFKRCRVIPSLRLAASRSLHPSSCNLARCCWFQCSVAACCAGRPGWPGPCGFGTQIRVRVGHHRCKGSTAPQSVCRLQRRAPSISALRARKRAIKTFDIIPPWRLRRIACSARSLALRLRVRVSLRPGRSTRRARAAAAADRSESTIFLVARVSCFQCPMLFQNKNK